MHWHPLKTDPLHTQHTAAPSSRHTAARAMSPTERMLRCPHYQAVRILPLHHSIHQPNDQLPP